MGMEQDPQKLFELAGEVWDAERKYGLIGRTASRIFNRKTKNQPVEAIDYRQEVVKAALENAVDKIAGQELTVEQAFQIVGRVVNFEDLEKLNSTWQGHWSEGASKVGIDDEERRTWWARLLAGEIQHPGTFSLRTMAVMDTLSTEEARLITRLCDYVWNRRDPMLVLPKDESGLWKPDFQEATILESIGIAKFNSLTGFNVSAVDETKGVKMSFHGHSFLVYGKDGKSVKLRCGTLLLTDVGKELYKLTAPNYSRLYLEETLAEWRQSHTVLQMPITAGHNS